MMFCVLCDSGVYGLTAAESLPNPAVDEPLATAKTEQRRIRRWLFLGSRGRFEHVKGVKDVVSG